MKWTEELPTELKEIDKQDTPQESVLKIYKEIVIENPNTEVTENVSTK